MGESAVLRTAIDLLHLPSEVHRLREEPLPSGIPLLLRVAAGEEAALVRASELTERPEVVVQEACAFFIEQILFAPDTDSYRVLGASPNATARELRGNMALLIRWLHPDFDQGQERSIFVGRVTAAWDNLKTKERRAAYDRAHPPKKPQSKNQKQPSRKNASGSRRSTVGVNISPRGNANPAHSRRGNSRAGSLETYLFRSPGPLKRILIALLGGMRQ